LAHNGNPSLQIGVFYLEHGTDQKTIGLAMTDLLDRFICASALREAIKSKLRAGARPEAISRLIASYVPDDIVAGRDCGRTRLPVELIPAHQRRGFFEALHYLPSSYSFAASESPQQRPQIWAF
jgi:hypothetical protein